MRKFIIKLLLFGALVSAIILVILMRFGGYVDYFYEKLAAPPQHSLIIGDSRSFQGFRPSVINESLQNQFELPILNFSFTIAQTAYGEEYTKSIKSKIDPDTKNGLFIVSVHPWLFAERDNENISKGEFFESDVPPNNMKYLSMNPNIEYFFRNYSYFHFKALIRRNSIVYKDGWLEEFYTTNDPKTLAQWRARLLKLYGSYARKWKKSDYRVTEFRKMIADLKRHGKVVVVRMPVDAEIVAIEENFWNNFDAEMESAAKESGSVYLNYTKADHGFRKYDGLHLDKESSARFTKSVCDSIKRQLN